MAEWEVVIGLEIHVELKTRSKVFCGCEIAFGGEPNTRVCPVCLGLPGSLPVLNEKAVEYAVMAGLALNCEITSFSKFDRKHFFYPDLPKAYQVSQFDIPVCRHGYLDLDSDRSADDAREPHRIGIKRIHLEEETGKSVHSGDSIIDSDFSLLDYNRAGIPLIEIVTEPDMRSPAEARAFLEKLHTVIKYTGVSDVKMQEGSLRCDANVSLRPRGSEKFGTKAEVKNMNSFRAVERALQYEVARQQDVLEAGGQVVQETRGWNEAKGETVSMRSKEEANDYRYFPEPDLVPLVVDEAWVQQLEGRLPELPDTKRSRFIKAYGLPAYDASVLTASQPLADYFERVVAAFPKPKAVSNWVMGEVIRALKDGGIEVESVEDIPVSPAKLVALLDLVEGGKISGSAAKDVFDEVLRTGAEPDAVVKEKGLEQISDAGELDTIVQAVLERNQDAVESYRAGKEKALGRLVGEVMKESRGKANPQMVNEMLREAIGLSTRG